jgi:hypothetical protein
MEKTKGTYLLVENKSKHNRPTTTNPNQENFL